MFRSRTAGGQQHRVDVLGDLGSFVEYAAVGESRFQMGE